MDGILDHKYVDASDDMAAYEADQCGRQAVTVKFAYEHLTDVTLYVYREVGDSGFDPWITIDAGIDKMINGDGRYILCHGSTGEIVARDDNFRVFVGTKTLERMTRA